MVSKARDDLPDPDSPVMTTSLSRGISTSMFLRLCSRAPLTTILFMGAGTRAKSADPEPLTVSDSSRRLRGLWAAGHEDLARAHELHHPQGTEQGDEAVQLLGVAVDPQDQGLGAVVDHLGVVVLGDLADLGA